MTFNLIGILTCVYWIIKLFFTVFVKLKIDNPFIEIKNYIMSVFNSKTHDERSE